MDLSTVTGNNKWEDKGERQWKITGMLTIDEAAAIAK